MAQTNMSAIFAVEIRKCHQGQGGTHCETSKAYVINDIARAEYSRNANNLKIRRKEKLICEPRKEEISHCALLTVGSNTSTIGALSFEKYGRCAGNVRNYGRYLLLIKRRELYQGNQ